MKIADKVKLLLGSVFWISGCITLGSLLISAAVMASTATEWTSGSSKFWYCLFESSHSSPNTLDAYPFWIFILVQFGLAIALFISAYYSHKKQT